MFSHIYVGVSDFARAHAFYAPVMQELGLRQRFNDPEHGWAAWQLQSGGRPLFIIGLPYDGAPHAPGNGQMTAFLAPDRATVDRVHATALAAGGVDEGARRGGVGKAHQHDASTRKIPVQDFHLVAARHVFAAVAF